MVSIHYLSELYVSSPCKNDVEIVLTIMCEEYYSLCEYISTLGEQGWRSGESARLPPMCPGFDSWTRRHMWVEFVIGSRPCSEGFSPGSPVFLPPQKPTFLNSNSIGNSRGHEFIS